jgi:sulfite reductase alpha subunit-like flavoprotein
MMATFGNLNIIQYKPGERRKWMAIEDSIFDGLKQDYSQLNNWQIVMKEAEPKLRKIKYSMKPVDYQKMDYHAEQAGKRFLEWVGSVTEGEVIEIRKSIFRWDSPDGII